MRLSLTYLLLGGVAIGLVGCGSASYAPPTTTTAQNATVNGQFNVVLTSTIGGGTTNVYTELTQNGGTLTGSEDTLVCSENDLSRCVGGDAAASVTASGTVNGSNVTIGISLSSTAGANRIRLTGTATGTSIAGTYTDTSGDSGIWTGLTAVHPFGPPPSVNDYSGTFNSTVSPLAIAPTISIELGKDAASSLTGGAIILNSPCVSGLTLSGHAIGDALRLSDANSKVSIIALPSLPGATNFNFSYKFDARAGTCAGDAGRGNVTINLGSFDY